MIKNFFFISFINVKNEAWSNEVFKVVINSFIKL